MDNKQFQAHIKAFAFFGGRPQEIVYDQDNILAVNENHGDIIYTDEFQIFKETIGFDVFLCHGADPESKGRIENVVKYLKHGFAEHRIFKDIDCFNADCIAWLETTGNSKVHETTKKIPAEVFALEKELMQKVRRYIWSRKAQKFPLLMQQQVKSMQQTHPISAGKGELIGSTTDDYREKSQSVKELEVDVLSKFTDSEAANKFFEKLYHQKRRYYRNQLQIVKKLFNKYDERLINNALSYCLERDLYSAVELKSATAYLFSFEAENTKLKNPERYCYLKNTEVAPLKYATSRYMRML